MFKLLPHRFKKMGLIIAPIGFFLWLVMQKGWISSFSKIIGLTNPTLLNISFAILGFFSFMFGLYALAFSKEKIEDEMIKNIRLESFQFAALLQIVIITIGLIWVGLMKNPPKDAGLMLFFIATIFIFWLTYITRFNYILHFEIYKHEE
ncbi:hypothetical protein [Mangrovimonas cancribranchiae]|uniref:DUF2178 domain-containing protein n=1 Tax=Mangrovimonas cancribranchiae TaxID=3080055 RepID=A0AAU6P228_9FLAO